MSLKHLLGIAILLAALSAGDATIVTAEGSAASPVLSRTFQKVRLGMAMEELLRLYPNSPGLARATQRPQSHQTVVLPASNLYVQRLEGKFHQGRLYEIDIYYRPGRVPRGYRGLLSRLKETYGEPAAEGPDNFGLDTEVLSADRALWSDGMTRLTLTERRKLRQGQEERELLLMMVDLEGERLSERALQERRNREEKNVPIPLPGPEQALGRTADVLAPSSRDPRNG